jgi:hypothetical protein
MSRYRREAEPCARERADDRSEGIYITAEVDGFSDSS